MTAPPQVAAAGLEVRMRAAADADPTAPAVRDDHGIRATHADLRRMRDGGRLRLREAGVARGDRVALVMTSDWSMAVSLLAVASAAAAAPLDPALTDRDMLAYVARLAPAAVVADAHAAPRLRELLGDRIPVLVWAADELDAGPDADADLGPADAGDVALLLPTSGTTAEPKIVQLTHGNLAAAADNVARSLCLGAADRALNAMTLHHGHGIVPGTLAPIITGGSTICTRLTNPDALLAVVAANAPTWYSAAPVIHHSLIGMARSVPAVGETLTLRVVRSTSAGLPEHLLRQLEQVLAAPVIEAFALTEAPGHVASNPLDGPRRPGTVGPAAGTEIALLTATGEISGRPGGSGEVLVRGPNVTPGYLGVADREQPFLDGWLRTGDRGTLDDDGYLSLGGRIAEVISRGAEKVAPAEIERVLADHSAVREVAAFGRPHPTLGDEPAVAVVLRDGQIASEGDLIAYAAQRLSTFKVPVAVYFMPALPRGVTGKILRRKLRERACASAPRPVPPR